MAIMLTQNMDHIVAQAVKSEKKKPTGTTKHTPRRSDYISTTNRAMLAGEGEGREDREWNQESATHIIECHENGKHKPSSGKLKFSHKFPPRYHHAMRAYRKRDGSVPIKLKKEIREKYKANGLKYGCWSDWQEIDNKYFGDLQTESPHQKTSHSTEAAEPQDDSESQVQEELAALKEEMANMSKAFANAKKKKKKKSSISWGESDDSESISSSEDESSEGSLSDDSESEDES